MFRHTRRALSLVLALSVVLTAIFIAPLFSSASTMNDFVGSGSRVEQPGDFLNVDEYKEENGSLLFYYAYISVSNDNSTLPIRSIDVILYGDRRKIGKLGAVLTVEGGGTYKGKVTAYTDGAHITFALDKEIAERYELYVSIEEANGNAPTFLMPFTNGTEGGYSGWGYDELDKVVTATKISEANPDSVLSVLSVDEVGTRRIKNPQMVITPFTPLNLSRIADNSTIYVDGYIFYAIKVDGTLWKWQENDKPEPTKIMDNVKSVTGYRDTIYAIKTDNSLWYWGDEPINVTERRNSHTDTPTKLMDDVLSAHCTGQTYRIGGGSMFDASDLFVIKTDGTLWGWGTNASGELGNGTTDPQTTPIKIMDDVISVTSSYSTNDGVTKLIGENGAVDLSYSYIAAHFLKSDGTLWSCGRNKFGELGNGNTIDQHTPVKIMDNVVSISANSEHATAITKDGTLWAWGMGEARGNHVYESVKSPRKIADSVKSIKSVPYYVDYFIKSDNTLWMWKWLTGYSPEQILDNVNEFTSGYDNYFAIKYDGTLWGWGANRQGELGIGVNNASGRLSSDSENAVDSPTLITANVSAISAGSNTLALKSDGSLWTWGWSFLGQQFIIVSPHKIMDGVKQPSTVLNSTAETALTASPSKTSFLMNGQAVSVPEAYNVEDNNYLQLRGIAALLNGTAAQFDVNWDGTYAVIETGKPYSGETNPATLADTTNVRKSNTQFKIDGAVVTFDKAYYIDGDTNYLQLREFAKKLNGTASRFNVYWDGELSSAVIEPGKPYTGVK